MAVAPIGSPNARPLVPPDSKFTHDSPDSEMLDFPEVHSFEFQISEFSSSRFRFPSVHDFSFPNIEVPEFELSRFPSSDLLT